MDFFNTNYFGLLKNGSLVLDNERGELVKALVKPGQRAASADKALIALRNHSEAERRRRERINAHLATLRTLVPGSDKMDKAALLGEVINQVKILKQSAGEAAGGTLVPTDTDHVRVEEEEGGSSSIRASLCCDFTHELLSDLREALDALPLKMSRAEIGTLGSRMVSVFMISGGGEDGRLLVDNVRKALRSVLDKFYASQEFSARNTSSKRRRTSFLGSSSAPSSLGEQIW